MEQVVAWFHNLCNRPPVRARRLCDEAGVAPGARIQLNRLRAQDTPSLVISATFVRDSGRYVLSDRAACRSRSQSQPIADDVAWCHQADDTAGRLPGGSNCGRCVPPLRLATVSCCGRSMQPLRARAKNSESIKGQNRTRGVSHNLDDVIGADAHRSRAIQRSDGALISLVVSSIYPEKISCSLTGLTGSPTWESG
jgi:hypothetical protein